MSTIRLSHIARKFGERARTDALPTRAAVLAGIVWLTK